MPSTFRFVKKHALCLCPYSHLFSLHPHFLALECQLSRYHMILHPTFSGIINLWLVSYLHSLLYKPNCGHHNEHFEVVLYFQLCFYLHLHTQGDL